jgi:site-specific DNA recombinase
MARAIVYARVSTEEQGRNTSLGGQIESCRAFAEKQGYKVLGEIRDESSGARLDRPGLGQVREMAARGEVEAVVVYDPDRLSRSNAHMWMLMEEFERKRVTLLFVNAPREDTPEGRMLFGMRALFAEYEREKIKERTRRGKERRARAGQVLSSAACAYGYTYLGGAGQGRYEVLEREANVVRQMFRWLVVDRMSMGKIVAKLNFLEVPTKRGGRWTRSTLRGIFTNETYTGTFYWNRHESVLPKRGGSGRKTEKSSLLLKDRSEWIAVPVPAIIDRETFELAQKQLRSNAENSPRNSKNEYLLRGMLVCGTCGNKYYGSTSGLGRPRRYRCRGRGGDAYAGSVGRCLSTIYHADDLEGAVWRALVDYLSDAERITLGVSGKDATLREEEQRDEREMESLSELLRRIEREQARLMHAYQQEVIELGELQQSLAEIRKRKEGLEREQREVVARIERRQKQVSDLGSIRELSHKAQLGLQGMSYEQKRAVLEVLEIKVYLSGTRVEVSGLLTDRLLLALESPTSALRHEIAYTGWTACGACAST